MKDDPIRKSILIVEDRISEILENPEKQSEMGTNGLLSDRCLKNIEKLRTLKQLSVDLAKFDEGIL